MEAKLYSPVFVEYCGNDTYGSNGYEELDSRETAAFSNEIHAALLKARMPKEEERGLMAYYNENNSVNEKVRSLFVDVEVHDGELWAVATLNIAEYLTSIY